MADSSQPVPPNPPPDRLERWFAAEVHAAEQDVKRGLVTVSGALIRRGGLGRRGALGGFTAATSVVVLLVVALTSGFLGGATGPSPSTGTAGVTASPAMDTSPATASPSGALYADGIPSTLEGQPVLRPTEAAARAAASTDASPFLIGGWLTGWDPYTGCPRPTGPEADQVLDQGFCGVYLAETPVIGQVGPVKLHFRVGLSDGRYSGPVIVRVHTHDPLAVSCAAANQDACAHAVMVDALVWDGPALGPDGLPSWIDGQATISVPEAQGMLAHFTSATELYVRGWYAGWALPCPYIPATVPPTPGSSLLPDNCQPSILGVSPVPAGQDHATASDLDLTLGPDVDAPPIGAVVLEIHGHDPAAAACDPSIRSACDAAVIVDRVVWTASTGLATAAPTITPSPAPVDVPPSR